MNYDNLKFSSDIDIQYKIAEDCANNICWLIDAAKISNNILSINGWALVTNGQPQDAIFTVNEVPFSVVKYSIYSPDLAEHFYGVANSACARFECYINLNDIPIDNYLRFEFIQARNTKKARRTAWWILLEQSTSKLLNAERIARVIGSNDSFHFEMGGATIFNRIQDYINDKFSLQYEKLHAILDWGCGAGRLLSQFAQIKGPRIFGSDIDHDNLKYCQESFPWSHCLVFPLIPPTTIPDATFDLIIGISVCTHLSEEHQKLWLNELKRISRPGGLIMLSVQGLAQSALYQTPPSLIKKLEQTGFVVVGVNPQINNIVDSNSYYLDVLQTREHIKNNWGQQFTIIEFLDGFAVNQDMVVMINS